MLWTALLVEKHPIYAFWIALERERTAFQVRNQYRRNADVIVDYLPFGEPNRGIENFVEVRKLKLFAFDLDYGFLFCHSILPLAACGT